MYCRYTTIRFDMDDRGAVHEFWHETGGPVVARQAGFQGGLVLESLENDGVIRAITLWKGDDDFERLSSGPENQQIIDGIRATSMSTEDRDGLSVVLTVQPVTDQVRLIRCRLNEGCADDLREFWQSHGRAIVESAPGCIKAEAFLDVEASELVFAFHWRTGAAAEAFRNSDTHNDEFVPAIERFVTPIARLRTESL